MMFNFELFLTNTLFYILLLTFSVICVLFVINGKVIISHLRKIKKETWVILILILILGSYLRFNSPGCSDQAGLCWSYVEEARNILEDQKLYDFWHPRGYSLLLVIGFFFLGLNFYTILYLNLALSSLTILLVFILSYVLFKKEEVSLVSALIYSLFPTSVFFANLNASEVSALFFVTLAFITYIISLKEDKTEMYLLSLMLLVFSIHVRLDNTIFIPIFLLGYFLERKKVSFEKLKIPFIIFVIFMLPLSYYYINGYKFFGPCGDPEVCEKYPDIFSVSYFLPNLQKHMSHLFSEDYPLLLYLFLPLPLLLIKRERNVIFPFLWVGIFFIFYCLHWGALFFSVVLYQFLLHPPFAILMGYGIYMIVYLWEGKVIGFKVPPILKLINMLVVLSLVIMVFHSSTNVFVIKKNRGGCLIENLFYLISGLSGEECILFENSKSYYHSPRPSRVMDVLFPDNHLALSLEKCGDRDEIYYIYINTTMCGVSFFGEEKPLLEYLKLNSEMIFVGEDGCAALYKIES